MKAKVKLTLKTALKSAFDDFLVFLPEMSRYLHFFGERIEFFSLISLRDRNSSVIKERGHTKMKSYIFAYPVKSVSYTIQFMGNFVLPTEQIMQL